MIDAKTIKDLKAAYEGACNSLAKALCRLWNISDYWWVGDTPCDGTLCFGDCNALNIEELIYVVEHNVSLDTFYEYIDYNLNCVDFRFDTISLNAYCEGAPRVPQETFDKLRKMKQDLDDAITDEKQKQKTAKKPF